MISHFTSGACPYKIHFLRLLKTRAIGFPFIRIPVYSDVCNRKIKVVDSTQSSALGAAILGAAAAPERITGFKNANEAAKKLGKVKDKVWEPNQDNVEIYNELYEEYKTLHTYFGTGINDVMKHLNNIRERRK